jgi:sn-glycerol 3-phosphate transport system ATP-binding protein
MNLLALRPSTGLAIAGSTWSSPPPASCPAAGLRPEHIRLADHGVPAQVETVEYFGADTIVGARIGSASLLVRAPASTGWRRRAIHLAWDARDQYFFEGDSGLRRP